MQNEPHLFLYTAQLTNGNIRNRINEKINL